MTFGMANVVSDSMKENPMADEQKEQISQPAAPLGKVEGNIPYGSLATPAKPVTPPPAAPPATTRPSAQPTAQPVDDSAKGQ
jgi:hypothetical protein